MTLKIIIPAEIDSSNISASNVDLEPLWDSGTSYSAGEQVRLNGSIWQAIVGNTNSAPTASNTNWADLGPPNRFRAFDRQIGVDQIRVVETFTENAESITYTLTSATRITGLHFEGLTAQSLSVVATETTTGDLLDLSVSLADGQPYNGSFWRWFFLPIKPVRQYSNFDVNIPADATIQITISNPGETAKVGSIVMGLTERHGTVHTGAGRKNRSRSVRRSTDLTNTLVRRLPSKSLTCTVTLQYSRARSFWQTIEDLDGKTAVFAVSDDHPELTTYGFHENVATVAEANDITIVSFEAQSL